jgi:hypothetical protein
MLRRVSGWMVVAGVLVAGMVQPSAQFAQRPMVEGISAEGRAQIAALLAEKSSRTPAQRKIASELLFAQRMARRQAIAAGVSRLEVAVPMAGGRAVVDVQADVTPALMARVRARGMRVVSENPETRAIRLEVTFDQLDTLSNYPEVKFVQPKQRAITQRMMAASGETPAARPIRKPFDRAALRAAVARAVAAQQGAPQAGAVQTQGDAAHKGATARSMWSIDGTGVKIGVLSDGVESLVASQASNDLPPVTVVPGQSGAGECGNETCDEGTAMLEIIHDIAPGAQLFFASAFTGIGQFATNIRTLRDTYACDIIIDDVFYFVETPFQDGQSNSVVSTTNGGVVIQAVKDVSAAGALYFSSAGNAGNLDAGTSGTWEGDFVNGGSAAFLGADYVNSQVHSFGSQNYNVLTNPGLGVVTLFWTDRLGGSNNDYDLFLLNSAGTCVAAASTRFQTGTQDPYEGLQVPGFGTCSPVNGRIVIVKFSGSARFMHLSTGRGILSTATAGEIHGHSATSAANSFAVAATPAVGPSPNPFNSSNTVETYSSDGPRRIFLDADGVALTPNDLSSTGGVVLNKPDFTAADCVSVTGAGDFPSTFCGTSAAAPHAGAIAALVKSTNLSLTAAQVRTALLASAIDIHATGPDRNSGAGIVMADTGVQNVLTPLTAIDAANNAEFKQPFALTGWAIDRSATSGTGVDLVQVYAQRSGGSPTFLGNATYGATRSDIGTAYGSRFTNSGFSFTVVGLSDGPYTVTAYARSTRTGLFTSASVTLQIRGPAMAVDSPGEGTPVLSSPFTVSGWAVDRAATTGTGVDTLHVWAFPEGSNSGQFLGVPAYGSARSDIGNILGSQFLNCGYTLSASLAPGNYFVLVYSHSTVTGAFSQVLGRHITIAPPVTQPYTYIDEPVSMATQSASQSFDIKGWAIDRGSTSGTGIQAIHVWAFPNGQEPGTFVNVGTYGQARPDVATVFDDPRFTNSGYTATVAANTFAPGSTWFFVVFANSTVTGGFTQSAGAWVAFAP